MVVSVGGGRECERVHTAFRTLLHRAQDPQILRHVPVSVRQIFDMDDVLLTAENLQLARSVALRMPAHGDVVVDLCPRLLLRSEVLGLQLREKPGLGRPVQVHAPPGQRISDRV
jgi:hypothetical protein